MSVSSLSKELIIFFNLDLRTEEPTKSSKL